MAADIKGSRMAVLPTARRNKLLPDKFGLPGKRAYPIEDKAHARDALARASEEANKGKLTPGQKAEIDAKAHRMLKG